MEGFNLGVHFLTALTYNHEKSLLFLKDASFRVCSVCTMEPVVISISFNRCPHSQQTKNSPGRHVLTRNTAPAWTKRTDGGTVPPWMQGKAWISGQSLSPRPSERHKEAKTERNCGPGPWYVLWIPILIYANSAKKWGPQYWLPLWKRIWDKIAILCVISGDLEGKTHGIYRHFVNYMHFITIKQSVTRLRCLLSSTVLDIWRGSINKRSIAFVTIVCELWEKETPLRSSVPSMSWRIQMVGLRLS